MSKRDVGSTPRFVFRNGLQFMRLKYQDGLKINWVLDKNEASPYTSRYSAKQHLGVLKQNHNLPEVQIEQI